MATQSSNVLNMLKEITVKEVDLAAEALARTMKAVTEAESKQALLIEYRQDYVKNLNKILEAGMGAEAYQNFQSFFKKLDQAINGQSDVVAMTKQQVTIQRQLWQESQRKKLSYDVLSQRSDKREQKVEHKRDQKMMDELAMRISRTKHA